MTTDEMMERWRLFRTELFALETIGKAPDRFFLACCVADLLGFDDPTDMTVEQVVDRMANRFSALRFAGQRREPEGAP